MTVQFRKEDLKRAAIEWLCKHRSKVAEELHAEMKAGRKPTLEFHIESGVVVSITWE